MRSINARGVSNAIHAICGIYRSSLSCGICYRSGAHETRSNHGIRSRDKCARPFGFGTAGREHPICRPPGACVFRRRRVTVIVERCARSRRKPVVSTGYAGATGTAQVLRPSATAGALCAQRSSPGRHHQDLSSNFPWRRRRIGSPRNRVAGIAAWQAGSVGLTLGVGWLFHKHGHHLLERITPWVGTGASAAGLTKSVFNIH